MAVSFSRNGSIAQRVHRGAAMAIALCLSVASAIAQDEAPPKRDPVGKFLTIPSPIDDRVLLRVTNVAQTLQQQAAREDRPAILVLEITPGTSQFHHVQALSRLLTSSQLSQVQTIAWVPAAQAVVIVSFGP